VVATTISGDRILGRMCRLTIAELLAPRAFAARTWSLAASTNALAEFKVFTDEVCSAEAQGSPNAAAVNS